MHRSTLRDGRAGGVDLMLSVTTRPSIADDAEAQILDMIRGAAYAPGDRLPSERQLAEQLGVSRTSIRAALGRLVALGLLDARPGSGTYIKAPSNELLHAALAPHIFTDHATLLKLFELREIIEVEAAGRAAQRATPQDVAALRRWVEAIETAVARRDHDGLMLADTEFHRQVVLATGNDVLVHLVDSVAHLLREMRYASTSDPQVLPGQRTLLAAIEARDSVAARRAMRDHLNRVRVKAETHLRSVATLSGA